MTHTHNYIFEAYQSKELETFQGPAGFAFETQVRINLKSEKEATEWLNKMQQHSYVTYRVTRTKETGLHRIRCKLEDTVNPSDKNSQKSNLTKPH